MISLYKNLTTGLRKQWLRSTFIISLLAVVVVVATFAVFIYSYYYVTVRESLEAKARTAADFFSNYVSRAYDDYYESAYRYTETFGEADRIELQFVDSGGNIIISSSGIGSGASPDSLDITQALESGQIASWVGRRTATGERIMAVSSPLLLSTDNEPGGVMRYVISLRLVDRQVSVNILVIVAAGFAVLGIVLTLNLVFTRFYIRPISEITQMARRIAEGSYGIQINEERYSEEIGVMVSAINEMSLKIARTDRMQTEFISSISHELRTPLTAITGWGETLIYNEDIKPEVMRGIDIMLKEAKRLTTMVEELLEFTRMQDGRFTLNVEDIDIAAELEDAIYAFRETLLADELLIDFDNDMLYDEPVIIPGDPGRLKQVFFNVFDNARKYGREGKRIEVYAGAIDDHIVITVRDFGPGVPEDELGNLAMKFYKGSNSKERGSGIGLSVCDEIIKYHGGKMELSNAEGGGFMVTITLPIFEESIDNDDF